VTKEREAITHLRVQERIELAKVRRRSGYEVYDDLLASRRVPPDARVGLPVWCTCHMASGVRDAVATAVEQKCWMRREAYAMVKLCFHSVLHPPAQCPRAGGNAPRLRVSAGASRGSASTRAVSASSAPDIRTRRRWSQSTVRGHCAITMLNVFTGGAFARRSIVVARPGSVQDYSRSL